MNMLSARLAARMQELGATDSEVAELAATDAERVADWREGETEIDGASAIRLRSFLADGNGGAAALERIRTRRHRDMRGDAATQAGIESVPMSGGYMGADAGAAT